MPSSLPENAVCRADDAGRVPGTAEFVGHLEVAGVPNADVVRSPFPRPPRGAGGAASAAAPMREEAR
jgi:hypothetical protein